MECCFFTSSEVIGDVASQQDSDGAISWRVTVCARERSVYSDEPIESLLLICPSKGVPKVDANVNADVDRCCGEW